MAAAIGRRPHSFSDIIGSGERRSCQTNKATLTIAKALMKAVSVQFEVETAVRSAITAAIAIVNTPALK